MAKQILLIFLVATSASLWAAPLCVPGPLSGYMVSTCQSLGVIFDMWSYDPGTTGIPSTAITVIPAATTPVFNFLSSGWTQVGGATTSGSIGFRGTGMIGGTRLFLGDGGFSGTTGGVLLSTEICLGSTLPACAGGTVKPAISVKNMAGSPPVILAESFYPLTAVAHIETIFTITGGDGGAGFTVFQSGLYESAVPEPGTGASVAAALVALLAWRRRRC